jgi:hypothetical protein
MSPSSSPRTTRILEIGLGLIFGVIFLVKGINSLS